MREPGQRKRLGLALGGGAARGLAHVGVIQVLEEAGIEADFVSGVSAGAIVGACYAAGCDGAHLSRLAYSVNWLHLAGLALLNPFRRGAARLGLIDFHNLEMAIIRFVGDVTFDELRRPMAIGATDLLTGEAITLTSGRVAPAVRASASVPGLVIPHIWRNRLLCDGFASNNLLIQALRDLGADVVLAVNIMPLPRRQPCGFFWAGNSAVSALILQAGEPLNSADLVVEPDLAECSYLKLDAADLIARGRAAAEPIIPQLQELLG